MSDEFTDEELKVVAKKMRQSKVGIRSKRKGKTYERRVASILAEFTGKNFRSTPGSGGFNKTGGQIILEHIFTGDVVCDDKEFAFSVEAKNRKDISLSALLKSPEKASLGKYWNQCVEDAVNNNKRPMMFFKPNISDDWVCLSAKDPVAHNMMRLKHMCINVFSEIKLPDIVLMDWKEFIKAVPPDSLFQT